MKTDGNDPAQALMPSHTDPNAIIETDFGGLTKREYFAAISNSNADGLSTDTMQQIVGEEIPISPMERVMFFLKLEAIYKVMQADALIKALNETPC